MEETWEIKGSYMGEARRKDVSRSTDKAIVSNKASDIFDRKRFQLEGALLKAGKRRNVSNSPSFLFDPAMAPAATMLSELKFSTS
jgi:hypothetical protein